MALKGYGKWMVGGLGWAFGGPLGGIMGFLLGSAFDSMDSEDYLHPLLKRPKTRPGDFRISLLVLSAAVMKADGKQLKSELDYIKAFFIRNFGVETTRQYMQAFKDILKQDIPVRDVCLQIRMQMDLHSRLQLLHFLFGVATADGHAHPTELKTIKYISDWLAISHNDFDSIKNMFVRETDSAYKILEIEPDASNEQIKKAYRNMALKYHPDKVSHLGEEFQLAAKDKFHKIKEAYDALRKVRGF